MGWIRKLERTLLILGLLLLGIYMGGRIYRAVSSRAALEAFDRERARSAQIPEITNAPYALELVAKPDYDLWSPKRIKDYQESLAAHFAPAIGILRVPKIHLEVPVLDGTDDWSLNRGVGRIPGTAFPGQNGNIGIAGHRDGFFRGLKDMELGDRIEIVTVNETRTYVIDRVVIVSPSDLSVLQPRSQPSLTLVTCYPFYFVGNAPERYIVQATISENPTNERSSYVAKK